MNDPEFVPPTIHGGHPCPWHVMVVDDELDGSPWVMHSSECGVSVSSREGIRYECLVQDSFDNVGHFGIFERHGDGLRRGTWLIRTYVVTMRGLDFTEHDQEWEVIRLVEGEYEPLKVPADG